MRLAVPCAAALLGACAEQAVYTSESFAADTPFKLKVEGEPGTACEGARRSLLGNGYLIEKSDAEQVRARKARRNADQLNTFIEINVVCVADAVGSTLFANGVVSTYDLKKSSSSASVGVSAVGSISLPIGQSADSLVKIGEETIDDAEFYRRFFASVQHTLGEMQVRSTPQEPPPAPVVATPAEPPAATAPVTAVATPAAAPPAATPDGPSPTLTQPAPAAAPGLPASTIAAPTASTAPDSTTAPVAVQAAPEPAAQPIAIEAAPTAAPVPAPVSSESLPSDLPPELQPLPGEGATGTAVPSVAQPAAPASSTGLVEEAFPAAGAVATPPQAGGQPPGTRPAAPVIIGVEQSETPAPAAAAPAATPAVTPTASQPVAAPAIQPAPAATPDASSSTTQPVVVPEPG